MRAARRWRIPPLEFFGVTDGGWHTEDQLLAMALEEYEDSRIDSLGFPKRLSEADDGEGWFEVREKLNWAQAALDEWRKNSETNPPAPGVTPYIVDTRDAAD